MDRLQRIRPIRNYTYAGYSLERSIRWCVRTERKLRERFISLERKENPFTMLSKKLSVCVILCYLIYILLPGRSPISSQALCVRWWWILPMTRRCGTWMTNICLASPSWWLRLWKRNILRKWQLLHRKRQAGTGMTIKIRAKAAWQ